MKKLTKVLSNKKMMSAVFASAALTVPIVASADTPVETEVQLADFTDIKGHWAEAQIQQLVEREIIHGYPDGVFKPNSPITRAEVAKVIVSEIGEHNNVSPNVFPDVKKDVWYTDYIQSASSLGYVSGYANGEFKPNEYMTRAEVASMLVRAYGITATEENGKLTYEDVTEEHWAYGAIQIMDENGLISGYPDGEFKPSENITRAELSSLLVRLIDSEKEEEEIVDETIEDDVANDGDVAEDETNDQENDEEVNDGNEEDAPGKDEDDGNQDDESADELEQENPFRDIEKIDFSFNAILEVGESETIKLVLHYKDGTKKDITKDTEFKIDDSSVAKIEKGDLVAVSEGEASLEAKYGDMVMITTVEVKEPVKEEEPKDENQEIQVLDLSEIEYDAIKIGDNLYGYDSLGENTLSYYMPRLYEAELSDNSKILLMPNDVNISSYDYGSVTGDYSTASNFIKFLTIINGTYKIVPSDNPFLDGNVKLPSYNGVRLDVSEINEVYPNNKLKFRYEDVYESISNTYEEYYISYNEKEYKVPTQKDLEVRGENIFDDFYFEDQGIRHISTFIQSPYIAINDLIKYFGMDKTISYGIHGDAVYLEIK